MKKPLKEIQTGDTIFLYEWYDGTGELKSEIEFRVDYIDKTGGGAVNLHLSDGRKRIKRYSFLDKNQMITVKPETANPLMLDSESEESKLQKENAHLREALEDMKRSFNAEFAPMMTHDAKVYLSSRIDAALKGESE